MGELKVSVSGIRGVVGKSLTPAQIIKFTGAFSTFIKKNGNKIAVAMDTRKTGPVIFDIVTGCLRAHGINVYDYGILPTPLLIYAVRKYDYDGGIIITASHNPSEWNALKFVKNPGVFINNEDLDTLMDIINSQSYSFADYKSCGEIIKKNKHNAFVKTYIDDLTTHFDVELIKKHNFNVAYDPVNATAALVAPKLFKKTGVNYTGINEDITANFNRGTEPVPENLGQLSDLVKKSDCEIGFAHDPDGDRLALVDENGNAIGEEYTLALSLYNAYKNKNIQSHAVVNLSTSMMNKDVAFKFNRKVHDAKVGEINVTEEMMAKNCEIGGEGNGGVIYPVFNSCRDSFVAIMFILELLAKETSRLSEIIKKFPSYVITKDKVKTGNKKLDEIYSKLKQDFNQCNFNELDGLKIESNDFWLHIRPSNTEPVIRIIAESADSGKNRELIKRAKENIIAK